MENSITALGTTNLTAYLSDNPDELDDFLAINHPFFQRTCIVLDDLKVYPYAAVCLAFKHLSTGLITKDEFLEIVGQAAEEYQSVDREIEATYAL